MLPSDNDYITNNKITIAPGVTQTYTLTVTFKDMGSNQDYNKDKTFTGKIEVVLEGLPYADASGASMPDLEAGMIPVIWNGTNWVVADPKEKWYDYDAQWWANAINVTESSRETYLNKPGTTVNMNDILFIWVWIPRYEYQYTNLSTQYAGGTKEQPGGISIKFIEKTKTSPSPNYNIHNAFWWDDNNDGVKSANEQLSGIWVAKFELSAPNSTINTLQQPKSIPNVSSWRNAQVGTFWTSIKNNMNDSTGNSIYGLSTSSDTHMMKNMEWGAVAYLSQSKYGKYGNSKFTGVNKEIYQNKSDSYITGCSYGGPSQNALYGCQYSYEKETGGTGASTTGNIYGVYDMSGGANEYVMGLESAEARDEPLVGINSDYNSGFGGITYEKEIYNGIYAKIASIGSKYYDLYDFHSASNDYPYLNRYHPGDATYETARWYSDEPFLASSSSTCSYRGGNYSDRQDAGIFYLNANYGIGYLDHSTRAVSVRLF